MHIDRHEGSVGKKNGENRPEIREDIDQVDIEYTKQIEIAQKQVRMSERSAMQSRRDSDIDHRVGEDGRSIPILFKVYVNTINNIGIGRRNEVEI